MCQAQQHTHRTTALRYKSRRIRNKTAAATEQVQGQGPESGHQGWHWKTFPDGPSHGLTFFFNCTWYFRPCLTCTAEDSLWQHGIPPMPTHCQEVQCVILCHTLNSSVVEWAGVRSPELGRNAVLYAGTFHFGVPFCSHLKLLRVEGSWSL